MNIFLNNWKNTNARAIASTAISLVIKSQLSPSNLAKSRESLTRKYRNKPIMKKRITLI
jgi:hypothetical protein